MIEIALIAAAAPQTVTVFESSFQSKAAIGSTVTSHAKLHELALEACLALQKEQETIKKYTQKDGFIDKDRLDDLMGELGLDMPKARLELSALKKNKDLKALRLAAGLSQQQLALQSKVTQPEISALEKGLKKGMRREKLERIQKALGISYEIFSKALDITQEVKA